MTLNGQSWNLIQVKVTLRYFILEGIMMKLEKLRMSKECKQASLLVVELSLKNVEYSLGLQDGRQGS